MQRGCSFKSVSKCNSIHSITKCYLPLKCFRKICWSEPALLKLGPFVDSTDDWLAFLTSMQMLSTLLGGLLIMMDDPTKPTYDPTFMGVTMIVVNSFGFFALLISLIMLHPKMRKKCNKVEQNVDDRNLSSGTTKVTPMRHRDVKIVDEEEEEQNRALKSWGKE